MRPMGNDSGKGGHCFDRWGFDDLKIKIKTPEGTPNVDASAYINITDRGPTVRSVGERGAGEPVNRPWIWPGPGDALVYDYRSGRRASTSNRCLILADGFCASDASIEPANRARPGGCSASASGDRIRRLAMPLPCPRPSRARTSRPIPKRQIIPLTRDMCANCLMRMCRRRRAACAAQKGAST